MDWGPRTSSAWPTVAATATRCRRRAWRCSGREASMGRPQGVPSRCALWSYGPVIRVRQRHARRAAAPRPPASAVLGASWASQRPSRAPLWVALRRRSVSAMDATTALELVVPPTPSSQDRGQTMAVGPGGASPSARRHLGVGFAVRVSFCAALDRREPAATDRLARGADQAPVAGEATCRSGIGAGHTRLGA